ncbi:MAG: hypothetical protein F6K36_26540 [Symploca sp. SIO3C6]|nr:hypothetical protein [Symploca sp. SIO3C6]
MPKIVLKALALIWLVILSFWALKSALTKDVYRGTISKYSSQPALNRRDNPSKLALLLASGTAFAGAVWLVSSIVQDFNELEVQQEAQLRENYGFLKEVLQDNPTAQESVNRELVKGNQTSGIRNSEIESRETLTNTATQFPLPNPWEETTDSDQISASEPRSKISEDIQPAINPTATPKAQPDVLSEEEFIESLERALGIEGI